MATIEVTKREISLKEKLANSKPVRWFKDHPDIGLTLLGGVLSIIGAGVKIAANKSEYEDNIFMTATDGDIYKVPVKKMKTVDSTKQPKKTE